MPRNQVYLVNSIYETYNITAAVNDTLLIRFNGETSWTTITLTDGLARTATQVANDINAGYGSTIASATGGLVRIDCPYYGEPLSAIYIGTTGSTAAVTLGFDTSDTNPVSVMARASFVNSNNYETYNITTSNNTFIFKFNFEDAWTVATLTIGAARTAQEIADDLNLAYQEKTGYANKAISAAEPITGSGNILVKLTAPIVDNHRSSVYIKNTGNTALSVLGFTGNDTSPIVSSDFLTIGSVLPYYNPVIAETVLTFAGAETKYFYVTGPITVKEIQFIRTHGADYTIYINDSANTPPFTVAMNETFMLRIPSRVEKFIITSSGPGSITIRELR